MTGTRFESSEQADAFSGLMHSRGADAAFVYDDRHSMVRVVLWTNNSEVFRGSISPAGMVREDLTEVAA